jgi:hypothetical protein
MPAIIQFRRGSQAQATSSNPILAEGELGLETDTRRFKIGDGTTAWNSLEYTSGVAVASSGTAFPTSPGFGDECYRTDQLSWYKWNGSVWTQI